MLFKKEKLFSKDNGSGGGADKNIITLTGESGTLTDKQIAQVQDDTAVLEIVCDGEVFRLSNKDSTLTYRTYINSDCALNENVAFKAIYVQLNSGAANYGAWTLEEVSAGGGGLPDQTGNAGKFLITDGTNASWGQIVNSGFTVKNASVSNTYMSIDLDSLTNVGRIGFNASGDYRCGFRFQKYTSNNWLILDLNGTNGGFNFDKDGIYWYSGYNGGFNNCSLGKSSAKWITTYTTKINNGADIDVPNVTGTMVVATPPSANGTYVLKATVADGVVTYTWVAE